MQIDVLRSVDPRGGYIYDLLLCVRPIDGIHTQFVDICEVLYNYAVVWRYNRWHCTLLPSESLAIKYRDNLVSKKHMILRDGKAYIISITENIS